MLREERGDAVVRGRAMSVSSVHDKMLVCRVVLPGAREQVVPLKIETVGERELSNKDLKDRMKTPNKELDLMRLQ